MSLENKVIASISLVKNNKISNWNENLLECIDCSFEKFMESAYNFFHLGYPKFHKMDNLSKLGFMTAEILLKDYPLREKYDADKIGVIISNRSSSLDTDFKYHNLLEKGVASPAIFVYSLPNLMIGEICIRHGIKGENTFFISDQFEIETQVNYINNLMDSGVVDVCIGGWVELLNENYESFLYLVEKSNNQDQLPFLPATVKSLFNQ